MKKSNYFLFFVVYRTELLGIRPSCYISDTTIFRQPLWRFNAAVHFYLIIFVYFRQIRSSLKTTGTTGSPIRTRSSSRFSKASLKSGISWPSFIERWTTLSQGRIGPFKSSQPFRSALLGVRIVLSADLKFFIWALRRSYLPAIT